MGKRLSKFLPKYARDFNLENRISNYIESDKKTLSPRYPSAVKYYEQQEANAPKVNEAAINKNVEEMVKNFEVTVKAREIKSDKPLPQAREPFEQFQYGYKEPKILHTGKITIKILDEIVNQYKESNKSSEKVDELAAKYKLETGKLLLLTEYYRPFTTLTKKQESSQKDKAVKKEIGNIFQNIRIESKK